MSIKPKHSRLKTSLARFDTHFNFVLNQHFSSVFTICEVISLYALIHQKQIRKPPNAKGKPAQQKF